MQRFIYVSIAMCLALPNRNFRPGAHPGTDGSFSQVVVATVAGFVLLWGMGVECTYAQLGTVRHAAPHTLDRPIVNGAGRPLGLEAVLPQDWTFDPARRGRREGRVHEAASTRSYVEGRVHRPDGRELSFQERPPRFREAFAGGVVGAVIGVPLGALLLKGAIDENAAFENEVGPNDNCCPLRRVGIGLVGASFIGAGAAVGAVQGIDAEGSSVYGSAVVGQLLIGGLGFGLGAAIGGEENAPLAGGIVAGVPAAALGAAIGALRGVSNKPPNDEGVQFRKGEWNVRVPRVRVQPSFSGTQVPSIHVPLLNVAF